MSRLNEQQQENIRQVFKQTASIRKTAKQTGHGRKAVRRALGCSRSNAPVSRPRKSKLDPYKAKIGYLAKEKRLSVVLILGRIRQMGYSGGYTILKDYVRTIRPKNVKLPRPPIDHAPGEEAQMDWSPHAVSLGGMETVVHTGSIVLCYSRWMFIRHFLDEKINAVIKLHEEAFAELDAVPEKITYDNMTTVGRHIGPGDIWINPVFARFAEEYGFEVVVLPPGKKERHGKVERPFHYIENNFLADHESAFDNLEQMNKKADFWRANTANVRNHGHTRERPIDRLERERLLLKPLPWNKKDAFYKEVQRLVQLDFCVSVDTNRYSVSLDLIGSYVTVRLYRDHLQVWAEGKLDCRHLYVQGRHQRQVLAEHEEAYKAMTGQRQLLKDAFLRLGKHAEDFYAGLKKLRRGAAGYHLQRILKYADRYGANIVAGAMAHAARFEAYSADAVLRIIKGKTIRSSKKKHLQKPLPENVRNWLRTCIVEQDSPGRHDKLVDRKTTDKKSES